MQLGTYFIASEIVKNKKLVGTNIPSSYYLIFWSDVNGIYSFEESPSLKSPGNILFFMIDYIPPFIKANR